jgi:DNA ligase-1
MTVIAIFNQLSTLTSNKDKQALLEVNKGNDQLKDLLLYSLNPYYNFYVRKMPEKLSYVKDSTFDANDRHKAFITLLDDLKGRYITGHKARDTIQTVFRLFEEDYYTLYSKILLKEAIGVGAATVNKVWPDFIPEFKVMLAPSELPQLPNLKYPLYVQPKLDGFRAIYHNGVFYSRTGKPMPNVQLDSYFSCLEGLKNVVLDGELYAHGVLFQDLSKTLTNENKAISIQLKYNVYDAIPALDWLAQKSKLDYSDRLKLLRSVVNNVANYKKVIDVSTDLVEDASEVVEIYKKYLKQGYEGCMLKAPNGKYQWKRVTIKSGEMLKLKPFKSEDLKVIGVYDGEGKFEGKAGGILVDYNGVTVRIGSGFDDALRDSLSKEPNSYIGKTAEIKYFEETEDGSLRFPIFERWRDDK